MLTFRGAPSGKALEAWRDNFSLKVGVVRIRTLVSKKYPIGKEGARARGPPDLGPWAQNLGPGPKIWALGPNLGPGPIFFAVGEEPEAQEFGEGHPHRRRVELYQRPDCTQRLLLGPNYFRASRVSIPYPK